MKGFGEAPLCNPPCRVSEEKVAVGFNAKLLSCMSDLRMRHGKLLYVRLDKPFSWGLPQQSTLLV